ncbi:MAG: alanine/ornithine racemase family PLP-dependent enzyme [Acholeplasmataceae bacterium]|nr:alanine/ornithine racemase family PLP-dependent enzyme [Acholeplasmataceae bacterium]
MYPRVNIHLEKYRHNVDHLVNVFHTNLMSIMAVSKVFCADDMLIEVLNESDVDFIADSRIDNLKKMKTSKPKVLLCLPQMSEAKDVVLHTDISLNSEIEVIRVLNEEARQLERLHSIILMFDVGDLREGIFYTTHYLPIIKEILELDSIVLKGIGTNLTCFGGVIPNKETSYKIQKIKHTIESAFQIKLEIISGGNSSSLELLFNHQHPYEINNLRIGEALVLGRETAYGKQIDNMHDDVFTLEAEIIEVKDKPSMPEGVLGMDAFGKPVNFTDRGMMCRAILACGKQNVDCHDLIAPEGVEILGCSSDHLIVNVSQNTFKLGDKMIFKMKYGGILSLMTSPYVRKNYVR